MSPTPAHALDRLPWALTLFRAACGGVPWLCEAAGLSLWIAAVVVPLALLSDVYDGIIARARGVATELLRRADGWADLVFVLSYTAFGLVERWPLLAPHRGWIIALAAYKALSTAHDFARYGRGAAFHFYSAKLWAIPYYGLLMQLVLRADPPWLLWPTLAMGFIAITEEAIATRLIPVWMHDQRHLLHAWRTYRAAAGQDRPAGPG